MLKSDFSYDEIATRQETRRIVCFITQTYIYLIFVIWVWCMCTSQVDKSSCNIQLDNQNIVKSRFLSSKRYYNQFLRVSRIDATLSLIKEVEIWLSLSTLFVLRKSFVENFKQSENFADQTKIKNKDFCAKQINLRWLSIKTVVYLFWQSNRSPRSEIRRCIFFGYCLYV